MLDAIQSPADLKNLSAEQLTALAAEVRERLISSVSQTGGHLASNLGAVEITLALAKIFDFPADKLLWDVGHQSYTWKLITGRADRFNTLRKLDGISGFPKREESPYDSFVAGHAGNAISAALGMAAARDLRGSSENVIAVVGDACIANGISFEALNNLADTTKRLIIILNDNEMSISDNVGAFSRHLGSMLASIRYNRIKARAERTGHKLRMTPMRHAYHRLEQILKSIWLRNALFEEFGLRYIGPVDGNNIETLLEAFTSAKEESKAPILVHLFTQKGRGYKPAERAPEHWHGVGPFKPDCGLPDSTPGYSEACGNALCALAQDNPKIVAITAAMTHGTGLADFAERYPDRFHDVGICEEHAVTFAAGLAAEGLRPVFAVYSSFLQRAVDCVMHDICLQKLPVVLCIDRAGCVGADGPTHHGMFDIPMLRCLPELAILQPADAQELHAMLALAFTRDHPVAIRYPRGTPALQHPANTAPLAWGKAAILETAETTDAAQRPIIIWAIGEHVPTALATAQIIRQNGQPVTVVNTRYIKPLDAQLLTQQAPTAKLIATIENGALAGGFGSAIRETLASANINTPVLAFGWPDQFIPQGTAAELNARYGLTPDAIAKRILSHDQPTP